ncbi:hypothetical protein V8G54_016404 [Vigna mungo]|uniref:Uncharacterized protein n=1 Tax=Vigna mungo TaxID=3915 RepID=A0AAQ3RXT9_VIGMU
MSTFLIISLHSSLFFPSFNPNELSTKASSSTEITPSLSLSNTSKASFRLISSSSSSSSSSLSSSFFPPIHSLVNKQNSSKSIKPSPFESYFTTISSTSLSVIKIPMFLRDSLSSCFVTKPSPFLSKVENTLSSSFIFLEEPCSTLAVGE